MSDLSVVDPPTLALDKRTIALLETIVREHAERQGKKRCPRCEQWKPLSDFNRDRSRPDGVQFCCRDCWSVRLEEKKSQMDPAARHRWEHDNYMRHRPRNVRRNWVYWSRRRLASPDLYVEEIDRAVVYERDNGTCQVCGQPIDLTLLPYDGDSFTIDHIKPVRDGGEHSYANVRAAHLRCNASEMQRLRRLKRYDEHLADMAADPLNGAAKDFTVMPAAIRRSIRSTLRVATIVQRRQGDG